MASDRRCLLEAHAQLRRAVFDAFPDGLEWVVLEVYELVNTHLHLEGVRLDPHESEVEAMLVSELDRRDAA
jgi:hypothetical protein